jgi:hypothetical protein
MEQKNFIYEEEVKSGSAVFIVPIVTTIIAFVALYYFTEKNNTPDKTRLYWFLFLGAVVAINLLQIWLMSKYELKLTQTQMTIKSFLTVRFDVNNMKDLEMKNTREAKREFNISNFEKNTDLKFYKPFNKNKTTEKIITFKRVKDDFRILICTNNPEQLFNLLVQYGAKKK